MKIWIGLKSRLSSQKLYVQTIKNSLPLDIFTKEKSVDISIMKKKPLNGVNMKEANI